MSLLNLTSDGLPNIFVVLYATVARTRTPMTPTRLLEEVAPEEVVPDPRLARTTLNRWVELGLFLVSEDDKTVTLAEEPLADMKCALGSVSAARMAARRVAMSQHNNADLWAKEESRAADLTRSLAWLLAQDIYRIGDKSLLALASEQLKSQDYTLMQNEARVSGLRSWAHFLGFCRQPGTVEIDPTVAIREVLPQCIDAGEAIPARDLVERLANYLPVLDGGAYRVAVQAQLKDNALATLRQSQLSPSLSRALFGFMYDRTLLFENRSDVGSGIAFTGRDGLRTDHRYTWVTRP